MAKNMTMILFVKLNPIAKEPMKSSKSAAGFDLHSIENCLLKANERMLIGTGLSFILPHNTFGWISSKTDYTNRGIDVSCAVLDSAYKGEIKVLLINNSDTDFEIKTGEAFAQIVFGYYFDGKIRASNQINRKDFQLNDDTILVVRKDFDTRFPERFRGQKISFDFLTDNPFLIASKSRKTINTGLRFVFSSKIYGLICGFPDLAIQGIDCIEGILDQDDKNDEITITLHNKSTHPVYFAKGERIARAIFVKNAHELSATSSPTPSTSLNSF